MRRLPAELISIIYNLLPPNDLLNLACCSHQNHDFAIPCLYASVDIIIGARGLEPSSMEVLSQLSARPELCRFVRAIYAQEKVQNLCSTEQSMLLNLVVSMIITSARPAAINKLLWKIANVNSFPRAQLPSTLTALSLSGSQILQTQRFLRLEYLDCGSIQTAEEIRWLCWHIEHCLLLSQLRIGILNSRASRYCNLIVKVSTLFKDSHLLQRLTSLSLEGLDVTPLRLSDFPQLSRLELKRCTGTQDALVHSMSGPGLTLKRLSLTILNTTPYYIVEFLSWLSKFGYLQELSLLLSGLAQPFPLDTVLLHASSLSFLVLDSRAAISDPTSIKLYSVDDLNLISQKCRSLKYLGLPLCLNRQDSLGGPVRRIESFRFLTPKCHLQVLHLRGTTQRHRTYRSCEVDAKHAGRPFIRSRLYNKQRSYVTVLIDHYPNPLAFRVSAVPPCYPNRRIALVRESSAADEPFIDERWDAASRL